MHRLMLAYLEISSAKHISQFFLFVCFVCFTLVVVLVVWGWGRSCYCFETESHSAALTELELGVDQEGLELLEMHLPLLPEC